MAKKYEIELTAYERNQLMDLASRGRHAVRELIRAKILLLADDNYTDQEIVEDLEVGIRTVERIRKRYALGDLEAALKDLPRSGRPPILNSQQEAILAAMACTDPPKGQKHWTAELLKERLMEDKIVLSVGRETIRLRLQESELKPWREKNVVCSETDASVPDRDGRPVDRIQLAL